MKGKRVLCWFTTAYIIGILWASQISIEKYTAIFGMLICACIIKVCISGIKRSAFVTLLFAFFIIGILRWIAVDDMAFNPVRHIADQTILFTGQVISPPILKEDTIEYVLHVYDVYEEKKSYDADFYIKIVHRKTAETKMYQYKDVLTVSGSMHIPADAMNLGGFNYRRHLRAQGIVAICYVSDEQVFKEPTVGRTHLLKDIALVIRRQVTQTIDRFLPMQQGQLLKAVLVGERQGFSQDMRDTFALAGIAHLTAVSGMHIAIFLLAITFLLKRLQINIYIIQCLNIFFAILFIFVTGATPSVVRAGLMVIIFCIAYLINREPDALTALFLAALIMLFHNPMLLMHVSFQLSFCATFMLLTFYKPLYTWLSHLYTTKAPTYLVDKSKKAVLIGAVKILVASITVQIGTIPIMAYHFNQISLVSVITNVLVIPLMPVLFAGGMILCVVGNIHVLLGIFVGGFLYTVLSFIMRVSEIFSSLAFAGVYVASPSIMTVLIYGIICMIAYCFISDKKNKQYLNLLAALLCVLIMVGVGHHVWQARYVHVTALNVGQGDCILIQCSKGRKILIDGGGSISDDGYDVGRNIVIPYLHANRITNIDIAMVSHYHADHAKGVIAVLEEMDVGMLILTKRYTPNLLKEQLKQAAALKDVPIQYVQTGDIIHIDRQTKLEILAPDERQIKSPLFNENDRSMVIKFIDRQMRFLFTGDIERVTEQYLLANDKNIAADVLKVAHHGSRTSSKASFIEAVSPKYAVIGVGRNNYGHPSKEVINRFEDNNIQLYRTDRHGTVTFRSDGQKITKVSVFKGE